MRTGSGKPRQPPTMKPADSPLRLKASVIGPKSVPVRAAADKNSAKLKSLAPGEEVTIMELQRTPSGTTRARIQCGWTTAQTKQGRRLLDIDGKTTEFSSCSPLLRDLVCARVTGCDEPEVLWGQRVDGARLSSCDDEGDVAGSVRGRQPSADVAEADAVISSRVLADDPFLSEPLSVPDEGAQARCVWGERAGVVGVVELIFCDAFAFGHEALLEGQAAWSLRCLSARRVLLVASFW